MHSRIFCLVETPKTNENYEDNKEEFLGLSESEVYESMQNVADYVSDETELLDDITWLKEVYPKIFNFTSGTTFTLNYDEIQKHFEDKIEKLKDKINNTNTLKEFFDNSYDIKKLIDDEFGLWFMAGSCWYETLDDFLEHQLKYGKDIDAEFEIVKTFDYHY